MKMVQFIQNALQNMNKIIIGSSAIKYWFPNFKRLPKDLDYIVKDSKKYKNSKGIEYLSNPIFFKKENSKFIKNGYITPDAIYVLKISHCFWDLENGSWSKHMWDVQWLKEKDCKFIPELFYELFNYWEELHGKRKTSNLNMSAEQFFDNVVNYPIEHDHLHLLLIQHPHFKGQNIPTYVKILKEGAEVDVSEEKFNNLTEEEKFNLVIEEVMVMALERYGEMYYKKAFNKMLKKFILSHAPIWETIWIIQNHKNLLQNISFNFIEYLNKKIKQNDKLRKI